MVLLSAQDDQDAVRMFATKVSLNVWDDVAAAIHRLIECLNPTTGRVVRHLSSHRVGVGRCDAARRADD